MIARRLGKLLGYGIPLAASLALNIVALPILLQSLGATVWSQIILTQTVGVIAAVVIAWGWAATGPVQVAAASEKDARTIFSESLTVRLILLPFALGAAFVVTTALTEALDPLEILCLLVTATVPAVGANWFFIGKGQPWRLTLFDSAPRILATALAIAVLVPTHSLVLFSAVQALITVVGVIIADVATGVRALTPIGRVAFQAWAGNSAGFFTTISAVFYTNSTVLIASAILSPSDFASLALAQRLFSYAVTGSAPLTQIMQSWVPRGSSVLRRLRGARLLALSVGIIGALVITFGLPSAARLASGSAVEVSIAVSACLGVAYFAIVQSAVTGLVGLVVTNKSRWLAASTIAGLLISVSLNLGLGLAIGLVGSALAIALAELTVLIVQATGLRFGLATWTLNESRSNSLSE